VRHLLDLQAKCREQAGLCGEGAGPWARIGDVPPFPRFYPSDDTEKR
jgi:hypothetical protein